jgi:hypothetical protein
MPAALIWPTVIGVCIIILGIVAIIVLRPALLRLIDRTSKAGKDGLTFERHQEGGKAQPTLASYDELMKLPITSTVLSREKSTEELLQSLNFKEDKQKISLLVRAFSSTQVMLEFAKISSLIFGSQLNLLIRLSGTQQGLNLNQTEEIFKQAQEKFPDLHKNRTVDEWLNYLLTNNLITRTTEKTDITQYGADFLKHLVDNRIAYERYG